MREKGAGKAVPHAHSIVDLIQGLSYDEGLPNKEIQEDGHVFRLNGGYRHALQERPVG